MYSHPVVSTTSLISFPLVSLSPQQILLENSHLPSQLYHQILPTVSQERHHSADLQDGLIGVDDFVEVSKKSKTRVSEGSKR